MAYYWYEEDIPAFLPGNYCQIESHPVAKHKPRLQKISKQIFIIVMVDH